MLLGTQTNDALWDELVAIVNAQFESASFRRLLSLRFSKERVQCYSIQMAHYVANRRDCWAYVQGGAPLDVKRLIWAHEKDELIGDTEADKPDHITLAIKEGEVLGLKPEDFWRVNPIDGAVACFYAWIHLAKDRPWLEAVASSAILEMRNSDALIRGGSLSRRIGEKIAADIGIPLKHQVNNAEHVQAHVEHGNLLLPVMQRHVQTDAACQAVLRGARESLLIDRVYRGHLADALVRLP